MKAPRWVRVRNRSHPLTSPLNARYCETFLCRLVGLTFRKELPAEQGLLLVHGGENRLGAAVHMLFVGMDLALIWANANQIVVDVKYAKRWRPFYAPKTEAKYLLEISPEWLRHFRIGDKLEFEDAHVV